MHLKLWAAAVTMCAGMVCARAQEAVAPGAERREILTPKPGPEPRINGPKVYGARPGRPFLYRIPCTGQRPVKFSAAGLPPALKLDAATGIITGTAPRTAGEYAVTLRAANARGRAERRFRIVVGETLALTPPMGWNDWYSHYWRITDKMMREAADAMIASGMADFGYQYVNIDDCWMVQPGSADPELGGPERDAAGALRPNRRFPDMKALADYIHAKGLKAGLYTSPGPLTCAKFAGSWRHEEIDARKFAEWGFDFLKYDWCSYGRIAGGQTLEDRRKPYALMGSILRKLDRDIVFNLCQYGMSEVWKWGGEVGGHAWRQPGISDWRNIRGCRGSTRSPSRTRSISSTPGRGGGTIRITSSSAASATPTTCTRCRSQPRSRRTSSTATCRCGRSWRRRWSFRAT